MEKTFTFFAILVTGILIAQVVCPKPPEPIKESKSEINQRKMDVDDSGKKLEVGPGIADNEDDDEDNDDDADDDAADDDEDNDQDEDEEATDDEEEEIEPTMPFLTCTLFKDNFACNAMCSILGSIYGTPITSGTCGDEKDCECEVSPTATLQDYWNKKFSAKDTLKKILRDNDLSAKVLEVLKTPFRTAEQTVQDLKPLLAADNIPAKDKSAQKIFADESNLDKIAVQKYVAAKLKPFGEPKMNNAGYKETLLEVLNNPDNKETVDYLINLIRQSKNSILNEAVDEYTKKLKIQPQQSDKVSEDQDTIIDILDTAIINHLIKPAPRETSMKLNSLRSKSKKPTVDSAQKPTTKPAPSIKPVDNDKPKESSTPKNSITNTPTQPNTQIAPSTQKPNPKDSRWTLHGFDRKKVDQLQRGDQCWTDPAFYQVCMYKSRSSKWLYWENWEDEKDRTIVTINISCNGDIEQIWSFENQQVTIKTQKTTCPATQTQSWVFPRSSLWYNNGEKTWQGPKDPQVVEKYKKFMDAWCAQNDFFVGKANCLAYQV